MKAAESLIKSDRNAGCNSAVWYKEPRGKFALRICFWLDQPFVYHRLSQANINQSDQQ